MEILVSYNKASIALGSRSEHQTWETFTGDCDSSEMTDLPATLNPTGYCYGQLALTANEYSALKGALLQTGVELERAERIATFRYNVMRAVIDQTGRQWNVVTRTLTNAFNYCQWTWAIGEHDRTVEQETAVIIELLERHEGGVKPA